VLRQERLKKVVKGKWGEVRNHPVVGLKYKPLLSKYSHYRLCEALAVIGRLYSPKHIHLLTFSLWINSWRRTCDAKTEANTTCGGSLWTNIIGNKMPRDYEEVDFSFTPDS
jgi:hypothetical protein